MSQPTIEAVIQAEEIRRVRICNAAGEAVGTVYVPEGGALVLDVLGYGEE